MKIVAGILTCPQRAESLTRTLADLALTDWPEPPLVCVDDSNLDNKKASQTRNAYEMLRMVGDCDYFLFLEDDVEFNLHLHHNLVSWIERTPDLAIGTLYHSDESDLYDGGGSQGLLLSRKAVNLCVEGWHQERRGGCMQDIRMRKILREEFPVMHGHIPDLVQHRNEPSTWRGRIHRSAGFNREWRA